MKFWDSSIISGFTEKEMNERVPMECSLQQIVTLAERKYWGVAANRAMETGYYSLAHHYFSMMLQNPSNFGSIGGNDSQLLYPTSRGIKAEQEIATLHLKHLINNMDTYFTLATSHNSDDPLGYARYYLGKARSFLTAFSVEFDYKSFVDRNNREANALYFSYEHILKVSNDEMRNLSIVVSGWAAGLDPTKIEFDPMTMNLSEFRPCLPDNKDIWISYRDIRGAENVSNETLVVYDSRRFERSQGSPEVETSGNDFHDPVRNIFMKFFTGEEKKNVEKKGETIPDVKSVESVYNGDPLSYINSFLRQAQQYRTIDTTRKGTTGIIINGKEREVEAAIREMDYTITGDNGTRNLHIALEVAPARWLGAKLLRGLERLDCGKEGICDVPDDKAYKYADDRSIFVILTDDKERKNSLEVLIEGNEKGSFKVESIQGDLHSNDVPTCLDGIIARFWGTYKAPRVSTQATGGGNYNGDPLRYIQGFMRQYKHLEIERGFERGGHDRTLDDMHMKVWYQREGMLQQLSVWIVAYATEIDESIFDGFDPYNSRLSSLRKKDAGRNGIRYRQLEVGLWGEKGLEKSVVITESANKGRYSITHHENIPDEVVRGEKAETQSLDYLIREFAVDLPSEGNEEVVEATVPEQKPIGFGDPLKFIQDIALTIGGKGINLSRGEVSWQTGLAPFHPEDIFLNLYLNRAGRQLQLSLTYQPALGSEEDIAAFRRFVAEKKVDNGRSEFDPRKDSLEQIASLGNKLEVEVSIWDKNDICFYVGIKGLGDGRFVRDDMQFGISKAPKGGELSVSTKRRKLYKIDELDAVAVSGDYRPYIHRALEVFAGVNAKRWFDPQLYADPVRAVSRSIEAVVGAPTADIMMGGPRFPIRKQTLKERIPELEEEIGMSWEKIVAPVFSSYYFMSTRQEKDGPHFAPSSIIRIGEAHDRIGVSFYDAYKGQIFFPQSSLRINPDATEQEMRTLFHEFVRVGLPRIDLKQVCEHLGCSVQSLKNYSSLTMPNTIDRFEGVLHALDIVPLYLYKPEQLTPEFIQHHLALSHSVIHKPNDSLPTVSPQDVLHETIDTLFTLDEAKALKKEFSRARLSLGEWESIPRLNLGMVKLPAPGMKRSVEDDFLLAGGQLLIENLAAMQIKTRNEAEEMVLRKLMHHYIHNEGFQLSRERAVEIVERLKAIQQTVTQEATKDAVS